MLKYTKLRHHNKVVKPGCVYRGKTLIFLTNSKIMKHLLLVIITLHTNMSSFIMT